MPTRAPIDEQHARYVLVSGFAKRRRVLELGCLDPSAAHVLFDAGATSVTVGTRDPDLAQHDVQTLDDSELPLPLDTRGFDVVLCHDLPERITRDPTWTHELRRVLAPGGILVAAVQNAASDLDYRGLYDLLAPHFGEAAFYGQSAVRGALFYDLEVDELEPEIDRTLLGDEDEEPTWYLAVFAPEALHGGKLTFAQLEAPNAESGLDVDASGDEHHEAETEGDADPLHDAAHAETEEELRTLELQYQEAQARLADHDQAMDEVMVRLETSELERRRLEEALRVAKSELQDLENELGAAGARALHAEQVLAQLQDARRHAAEHDQATQDAHHALHGRIAELERTMSERETHRHEERALLDAEIGELVTERERLTAALRSADDRAKNLANDFEAFRNSAYGRERELAKLIEQLEANHARARESDTQ